MKDIYNCNIIIIIILSFLFSPFYLVVLIYNLSDRLLVFLVLWNLFV